MKLNSVTVQRATKTKVSGGFNPVWNDLTTVSLHYYELSAKEVEQNLKLGLKTDSRFIYFGGLLDVTEEDRLVMNNTIYDVMSVRNPHLLNHHTEITCRKNG